MLMHHALHQLDTIVLVCLFDCMFCMHGQMIACDLPLTYSNKYYSIRIILPPMLGMCIWYSNRVCDGNSSNRGTILTIKPLLYKGVSF